MVFILVDVNFLLYDYVCSNVEEKEDEIFWWYKRKNLFNEVLERNKRLFICVEYIYIVIDIVSIY